MKKIYIILIILVLAMFPAFGQNVVLNHAGHMVFDSVHGTYDEPVFLKKMQIELNSMALKGNGFFKIDNGYMTVESYEASVPVIVRFYNEDGDMLNRMQFRRTYGIQFSPNKKYTIFFDAQNMIVINLNNYNIDIYPQAAVYAVDNEGFPVYYDENMREIVYGEHSFPFIYYPVSFVFNNHSLAIFTRRSVYRIENNNIVHIQNLDGTFFRAASIKDDFYFVTKTEEPEQFIFILNQTDLSTPVKCIQTVFHKRSPKRHLHEPIQSPLKYGEDYPHPIGNSYGQIQDYSGSPYLHPGVDFLGEANEAVYAVADGVVKAVLTTGGDHYWRIAIANEDTAEETEGYLYAHLIQNSIPFAVGDSVKAGDIVGELIYWPWYNFTHIHFARIKASGTVWNGAWWTTNDPLMDVTGYIDTTPPVFEHARPGSLFAFRNENGIYLNPTQLNGKVRIICKAYDKANAQWKIDVSGLSYEILNADDVPVIDLMAWDYDFPLDTYFSNNYQSMILNTVYSRDGTCFSIANYETRHHYQMITNTSGDKNIYPEDQYVFWDTEDIPDGTYTLFVTARDAAMNETTASMTIGIKNSEENDPDDDENNDSVPFRFYPNPANDEIHISSGASDATIKIYNSLGQLVIREKSKSIIDISGLSAGLYILIYEKDMYSSRAKLVVCR